MPPTDLTSAERVALAGSIKPKQLHAAKSDLKETSTQSVDLAVRVTGQVTKGAESYTVARLTGMPVVTAVLSELGIGPKRLERALVSVTDNALREHPNDPTPKPCEKLEKVFDGVAEAVTEKLPEKPKRAGSCSFSGTIERVLL